MLKPSIYGPYIGPETWRLVPDYRNYIVSNYGEVRSFKHYISNTSHVMKQYIDKKGKYVKISNNDNKTVKAYITDLVEKAFDPSNPYFLDEIDPNYGRGCGITRVKEKDLVLCVKSQPIDNEDKIIIDFSKFVQ